MFTILNMNSVATEEQVVTPRVKPSTRNKELYVINIKRNATDVYNVEIEDVPF
jgi:hypothetical protein